MLDAANKDSLGNATPPAVFTLTGLTTNNMITIVDHDVFKPDQTVSVILYGSVWISPVRQYRNDGFYRHPQANGPFWLVINGGIHIPQLRYYLHRGALATAHIAVLQYVGGGPNNEARLIVIALFILTNVNIVLVDDATIQGYAIIALMYNTYKEIHYQFRQDGADGANQQAGVKTYEHNFGSLQGTLT
jgi:hypothetical protein